jgi:hypothetical protein
MTKVTYIAPSVSHCNVYKNLIFVKKNMIKEAQKKTPSITTTEDIYPLTIMKDRYSGVYSEGAYLAFNDYFHHLPKSIAGSDGDCIRF